LSSKEFDLDIFFSVRNPLGIYVPELKKVFNNKELSKLHLIKNYWVRSKILIWQSSIIRKVCFSKFDYIMLLGEMHIISSWIAIFISKLRKKKVFIWSHGIYGNENEIKKAFRLLFLRQANVIFLYEERAKNLLLDYGFKEDSLEVVYNSLDFDLYEELYCKLSETNKNSVMNFFKDTSLPTIIFIGRLTANKKIDLLIDAINKLNKQGIRFNLLIVGGGEKLNFFRESYVNFSHRGWLHFFGSCYDDTTTSKLIYHSDLCVSPGNIGLTAIHSLSFGTPVASHDNFKNQMPEVEAIIDGENGFLFKENDFNDMASKINNWFLNNAKTDKNSIRKIIKEKYNPEVQLSIFTKRFING